MVFFPSEEHLYLVVEAKENYQALGRTVILFLKQMTNYAGMQRSTLVPDECPKECLFL